MKSESMMRWTFIIASLVVAGPLSAHHSVGVFETTTPIRVKGFIDEVYFGNPHSSIFIDALDADGQHVRWAVENSGTLAMTRQRGFDENSLQIGDPIEVCGYAPKRSFSTPEELAGNDPPRPAPAWWGTANRVITGRLLILKSGPAEHWSHYGPLEACRALLQSE